MRILYDSHQLQFKTPFGTLTPLQPCTLHIHIPVSVGAVLTECLLEPDDGASAITVPMELTDRQGAYQIYSATFSLPQPGLFFYYFRIHKPDSSFRLFKQGHDTNMEAGDRWQLSCIPSDFSTPDWAKGGIIYQIFPDRFHRSGNPDIKGKLEPYRLHTNWNDEVHWQPDKNGKILNNDFFGGNFQGITEKMDYIASLGTTLIYLNPICKSFSNHRYDTADYKTPDPLLGTLSDFSALCRAAHDRGIRVIVDGVFSHTGANSIYFDKYGTFGGHGAYHDPASAYSTWFTFERYPDLYKSWWGFDTLPTVNKSDPAFIDYIIDAPDSVIAHWLRLGADGFRLDVVDELPDSFVLRLKQRLRQLRPDALLLGEVWEDASNKIAYGVRRRYFVDGALDACMNYPFRTAMLRFLRGQDDGRQLAETVMTLAENYPPQVLHCNMNLLGSHDTARILTELADPRTGTRAELAHCRLTPEQYTTGEQMLYMATFLQYTLPGSPSIYYGDEAGMEGYADPFNRRTFPWGQENTRITAHYRDLGILRKTYSALCEGDIHFCFAKEGLVHFQRDLKDQHLHIWLNRSEQSWDITPGKVLFGHKLSHITSTHLTLEPMGFCITEEH